MKNALLLWLKRTLIALGIIVLAVLCTAAASVAMLVASLRAAPGEWSQAVSIGPWRVGLSVPAVLRLATHPLGLRALAGRSFDTSHGTLRFQQGADESSIRVVCEPCTPHAAVLGKAPLRLQRTELSLTRVGQNHLHGEILAGAVRATWKLQIEKRSVDLRVQVPDAPIADFYAVVGASIPELERARIEGRAGAELSLALPSRAWRVLPRIEGFSVSGLGTEALLGATPLLACARPARRADAAAPFGVWLPRAVVAAEDQRYQEHAGYDLIEMRAAWRSDGVANPLPRGASTLTQQLAKLLYTGDERSAVRKLREVLYAVEMDRVLGKARVLELYMTVAPWGGGHCGAQAASLHLLNKRASALTPIEAAWLVSLLRNPEAELGRATANGSVDKARIADIVEAMRPLARSRREELQEQLADWAPPATGAFAAR
ncbi:MAG: biosynthetic peptidoglycan transglycosylase [Burkholderiales bacterium]|nr:biosynthetic peptidoglycan transglycosylase [Burkholderiales bacterium]